MFLTINSIGLRNGETVYCLGGVAPVLVYHICTLVSIININVPPH